LNINIDTSVSHFFIQYQPHFGLSSFYGGCKDRFLLSAFIAIRQPGTAMKTVRRPTPRPAPRVILSLVLKAPPLPPPPAFSAAGEVEAEFWEVDEDDEEMLSTIDGRDKVEVSLAGKEEAGDEEEGLSRHGNGLAKTRVTIKERARRGSTQNSRAPLAAVLPAWDFTVTYTVSVSFGVLPPIVAAGVVVAAKFTGRPFETQYELYSPTALEISTAGSPTAHPFLMQEDRLNQRLDMKVKSSST
jgi:hypothetical protein